VVVRGEKSDAADVGGEVVQHGVGDGQAVVGGRAAPELVEDDERAGGCVGEDFFGLGELEEEGALGGEDVVGGAETRHDAVGGGEGGGGGGDVAA